MLMASCTHAQNLFVSEPYNNAIAEITPGGVQSTFASRLNNPWGLAFNRTDDLFEADGGSGGNIYEFTPGGVKSTFASGLQTASGLAFNSAGDLFGGEDNGIIYEYTPGGVQSTFTFGLSLPINLAFQGETLPVPEPSACGLLAVGAAALFVRRRSW